MSAKRVFDFELSGEELPFPGYESRKIKPQPDIPTFILIYMVKLGFLGGKVGRSCYSGFENTKWETTLTKASAEEKTNEKAVYYGLLFFLPVFLNMYHLKHWPRTVAADMWKEAIDISETYQFASYDEWVNNCNDEAIAKLQKMDKESMFSKGALYNFFMQIVLFKTSWMENKFRTIQEVKLIHRLMYLLLTNSIIQPTIKEAQVPACGDELTLFGKLSFKMPSVFKFENQEEIFNEEMKVLTKWVNKRFYANPRIDEVTHSKGVFSCRPSVRNIRADEWTKLATISFLRFVVESFNQTEGFLSLGQIYLGICCYCGEIFVRSKVTQNFCSHNSKNCRQKHRKIVD